MREIKFRIWDKQENKWYEPTYEAYRGKVEDLTISTYGELIMRKNNVTIHESIFPDRFILSQYTGLKDANGVEIYEGDLCGDGIGTTAPIEWSQDHCQFLWMYEGDVQEIGEWCIVVGNIYEGEKIR